MSIEHILIALRGLIVNLVPIQLTRPRGIVLLGTVEHIGRIRRGKLGQIRGVEVPRYILCIHIPAMMRWHIHSSFEAMLVDKCTVLKR